MSTYQRCDRCKVSSEGTIKDAVTIRACTIKFRKAFDDESELKKSQELCFNCFEDIKRAIKEAWEPIKEGSAATPGDDLVVK